MELSNLCKIVQSNSKLFQPFFSDLGLTIGYGFLSDEAICLFIDSKKKRATVSEKENVKEVLKAEEVNFLFDGENNRFFWAIDIC